MYWIKNTGGRERYYKATNVRDCVTRAIAIANNMDYKTTYKMMWEYQGESPRNGVYPEATDKCLFDLGWEYKDLAKQRIRMNEFEFPNGIIICRIKGHITTIIDGVINDTWNCSIKNPVVIGYWHKT